MRLSALLALVVLAGALQATSAIKLDVATMTEKADVIIIAKVDGKEAKWDAGKKGIWTHHDVTVSETLKGAHEKSREVVTRGGVVGRIGQHVAGSGAFNKGEEYVFFLWEDDDERLRLVGMVQGAFRVTETDGVSNAKNSVSGLTILDEETLKPARDKVAKLPLEFTLADLKKKVTDAKEAE